MSVLSARMSVPCDEKARCDGRRIWRHRPAYRSRLGDALGFNGGGEVSDMNSIAWPNVLTNTLAAVYRADQADPTFRRAREVVMLEAGAYGGTPEDGQRAIEVWEARGCLARLGPDWRITDRGRDEAKRLIKHRLVTGHLSAASSTPHKRRKLWPKRRSVETVYV